MLATPDPASLADSETLTGPPYQPLEQAPPPQAIDEVGGVVSIWIACDFVASTLLALSQARNFTVLVADHRDAGCAGIGGGERHADGAGVPAGRARDAAAGDGGGRRLGVVLDHLC